MEFLNLKPSPPAFPSVQKDICDRRNTSNKFPYIFFGKNFRFLSHFFVFCIFPFHVVWKTVERSWCQHETCTWRRTGQQVMRTGSGQTAYAIIIIHIYLYFFRIGYEIPLLLIRWAGFYVGQVNKYFDWCFLTCTEVPKCMPQIYRITCSAWIPPCHLQQTIIP